MRGSTHSFGVYQTAKLIGAREFKRAYSCKKHALIGRSNDAVTGALSESASLNPNACSELRTDIKHEPDHASLCTDC